VPRLRAVAATASLFVTVTHDGPPRRAAPVSACSIAAYQGSVGIGPSHHVVVITHRLSLLVERGIRTKIICRAMEIIHICRNLNASSIEPWATTDPIPCVYRRLSTF